MRPANSSTVLVVGSGGREHALTWALARSDGVDRVLAAPGNGGTALEPRVTNVDVQASDTDGLVALAQAEDVALVVIGPEDPLANGLADALRDARVPTFGPSRAAATLESSKSWAREFMRRHAVPHPRFVAVDTPEAAERAIDEFGGRCVVKADGLAAGKGVIVADDRHAALGAADRMLRRGAFGAAGNLVLIEERLEGPELSVLAVADGTSYRLLPPAQDHKRLLENDEGPNTGGMGAYAPAPLGDLALLDRVREQIIEPTLAGMVEEGRRFSGCLYCGLMVTESGPAVIEFNVRFGDPETQVQLPLLRSDLFRLLLAAAQGELEDEPVETARSSVCVGVVLASDGYPGHYDTGLPITGLDRAEAIPGVKVFHAGTRLDGEHVVTSGGRVLNVTCIQDGLAEAQGCAYSVIGDSGVRFAGMQYRQDIARRTLFSGR